MEIESVCELAIEDRCGDINPYINIYNPDEYRKHADRVKASQEAGFKKQELVVRVTGKSVNTLYYKLKGLAQEGEFQTLGAWTMISHDDSDAAYCGFNEMYLEELNLGLLKQLLMELVK